MKTPSTCMRTDISRAWTNTKSYSRYEFLFDHLSPLTPLTVVQYPVESADRGLGIAR